MDDVKRHFLERDTFARALGIEMLEVDAGSAAARMTIRPDHLNGARVAHGGAVFTLADFAFAAASNSHGTLALSINASMSQTKGVREGATLTARAAEVSRNPKLAVYSVLVTDETGEVVALFQGMVYRKTTPLTDLMKTP